ncbi:Kelch repeat-containing protein [Marinoscillum furvescens]|uniref:N-acetylneuraminic acid mutarotase n=1 Tax=Marinoscillum furvescens DSM 4134 TaxID=1122208 RepID=A0A3D9L7T6_MARFU|nr:kelch repeat-containing protein [Marinoscillum furvescens]REE01181.1 N-acetylneuraminic acid mutarotase [Marinoscillum furvescens DSM 4134]
MKKKAYLFFIVLGCLALMETSAQAFETITVDTEATPRHECGFVACRDELFLIGGRGVKPVERFDPQGGSWQQLNKTPLEIHHFQPVSYNQKVYIAGAFTGKYPHEVPVGELLVYDPGTDRWSTGPDMPKGRERGAAACVVVGDKLFLVGGILDGHSSGTVAWADVYDFRSGEWQTLPDAPNERDHVVAASDGAYLYVLGGRESDFHKPGNFAAFFSTTQRAVGRLNLETYEWETLPDSLPVPTAGGAAAFAKGKIYYTAGESGQKSAHDQVQVYDIAMSSWSIVGRLQRGRHGTGLAVLDDVLYTAAGSGNQGGGPELGSIEQCPLTD